MNNQIIPVIGLLATMGAAGYMVVQLNAQATAIQGDFSTATIAEVRDAQGVVVLRGTFATVDEDDDDVERKAVLEQAGADTGGSGTAEIEISMRNGVPGEQEIEFEVRNLAPRTPLTFAIDGRDVATATTSDRGSAEVELDVPVAGATTGR